MRHFGLRWFRFRCPQDCNSQPRQQDGQVDHGAHSDGWRYPQLAVRNGKTPVAASTTTNGGDVVVNVFITVFLSLPPSTAHGKLAADCCRVVLHIGKTIGKPSSQLMESAGTATLTMNLQVPPVGDQHFRHHRPHLQWAREYRYDLVAALLHGAVELSVREPADDQGQVSFLFA